MRVILQSSTYQRSSLPIPENKDDRRFLSRYYPRRMSAEILLDAISQVTEVPSQFNQIGYDGNDFQKTDEYPVGTRAIQLYDSAVVSNFLKPLAATSEIITCECERSNTPSMVQVLHINNGVTINDRLKDENSCVMSAVSNSMETEKVIERAYLTTLSRFPTDAELKSLISIVDDSKDVGRAELLQDLYWSIMSSREFLFNH